MRVRDSLSWRADTDGTALQDQRERDHGASLRRLLPYVKQPCRLWLRLQALDAGPSYSDFLLPSVLLHWGCGSDSFRI